MLTTVPVTQFHIQTFTACSSMRCPVAMAIKQLLKPELQLIVIAGGKWIDIHPPLFLNGDPNFPGPRVHRAETPPEVAKFMHDFDVNSMVAEAHPHWHYNWRNKFRPFEFPLEIPVELLLNPPLNPPPLGIVSESPPDFDKLNLDLQEEFYV